MSATLLHVSEDLDLPEDVITESNAVLGKKGSGKTSTGVVLYEEIYAAGVPVVAVDPKGDWYGIRSSSDGKHKGLPVPVFGGLHGDIPLEASGGKALATLIREQHMSCILDVSEFSAAERRRFLTPFADQLYRADDRTPMHLLLEEAHEYIPQRVDSGDAPMVGVFERLVKNGRFKGIGVTMLSQRSASLNKNVLTQVDNLFVMRTTSPQDRAAVGDWIKYQDGATEILQSMSSLASGECWLYQPNRGEPVRFQFRMRTTFDAGATPKIGQARTQPTNLADVNLSAIAAAMAETIEKAKADDPKELRRRISDLERDLKLTKAELMETAAESERRYIDLQNARVEPVEVPALTDDDRNFLIEQANTVGNTSTALGAFADRFLNLLERGTITPAQLPRSQPSSPPVVTAPVAPIVPASKPAALPRSRTTLPEVQPGALTLGKAHRLVLTVLAQRGIQSAQQVATLTGYAAGGGGFNNAIGALRSSGYIVGGKDALQATDEGLAALGDFEPMPTGRALIDFWLGKFGRAERLILEQLVSVWPASLTRDELADRTEYAANGGGFNNAIGKLRSLTLISGTKDALFADDELGQAAQS